MANLVTILTDTVVEFGRTIGFADTGTRTTDARNPVQTIGIRGTLTSNDALPGNVGEQFVALISDYPSAAFPKATFPDSGVWGDMGYLTLTPGDWDVSFMGVASIGDATSVDYVNFGVSLNSGTASPGLLGDSFLECAGPTATNAITQTFYRRLGIDIEEGQTVYFKFLAGYSGGAPKAVGHISARRMR